MTNEIEQVRIAATLDAFHAAAPRFRRDAGFHASWSLTLCEAAALQAGDENSRSEILRMFERALEPMWKAIRLGPHEFAIYGLLHDALRMASAYDAVPHGQHHEWFEWGYPAEPEPLGVTLLRLAAAWEIVADEGPEESRAAIANKYLEFGRAHSAEMRAVRDAADVWCQYSRTAAPHLATNMLETAKGLCRLGLDAGSIVPDERPFRSAELNDYLKSIV